MKQLRPRPAAPIFVAAPAALKDTMPFHEFLQHRLAHGQPVAARGQENAIGGNEEVQDSATGQVHGKGRRVGRCLRLGAGLGAGGARSSASTAAGLTCWGFYALRSCSQASSCLRSTTPRTRWEGYQ